MTITEPEPVEPEEDDETETRENSRRFERAIPPKKETR